MTLASAGAHPNAVENVRHCSVLGMRVDEMNYDSAAARLREWSDGRSRYVCVSNVHMALECYDHADFRAIVNAADLVVADGMPIVWSSRCLGLKLQDRVFGPILTFKLCEMAAREGISVGFYGSTADVVRDLARALSERLPGLELAYCHAPPYRPLSPAEDAEIVENIKRSGVQILFVGLGCPKQERWMSEHRGRIPAAMLGVGWAFDILAGRSKMAPRWIQDMGMEWFYRLVRDPQKVWRRQLKNNPRFVVLILLQLLGLKTFPLEGADR